MTSDKRPAICVPTVISEKVDTLVDQRICIPVFPSPLGRNLGNPRLRIILDVISWRNEIYGRNYQDECSGQSCMQLEIGRMMVK